MQQAAYERVKRMQEHSRKLCTTDRKENCKPTACEHHRSNDRRLLLLVLLILLQNGSDT